MFWFEIVMFYLVHSNDGVMDRNLNDLVCIELFVRKTAPSKKILNHH